MSQDFDFENHPKFVAIVGSREWTRSDWVEKFVNRLNPHSAVISGGARGVDTFAEIHTKDRKKRQLDIEFKPFTVESWEWMEDYLNKAAGHIRNFILVMYIKKVKGHVVIFALTDNNRQLTGGSKNVRDLCVEHDVPYTLYTMPKETQ